MKKYLLVIAALACCSAIAQAGIIKDYFTELCAKTAIEPIGVPSEQIIGRDSQVGAEVINMAAMTDETQDKAVTLAESWDKSKLMVDVAEEINSLKIYAEIIEGMNKAECLMMIKDGDSPLVFIYMEGNAKMLEYINDTNE